MQKKLRFGMVGGGPGSFIADVHKKGVLFDGMCEMVAGCFSRNYDNNLKTGENFGLDLSRVYKDFHTMAEKEAKRKDKIDFVIIVAPNNVHYECAKVFLENNINVVCDKPLALHSKEAEELQRITYEKDLLFCITYTYAGCPAVEFMRKMIKKNLIGEIYTIDVHLIQDWIAESFGEEQSKQIAWRLSRETVGNSMCVADIGTHAENLASRVLDLELEQVFAQMDYFGENMKLDTNAHILLRYKGGVTGHIWCSVIAAGNKNNISIGVYGSKGSLEWKHDNFGTVIFSPLKGNTVLYHMKVDDPMTEGTDIRHRLPALHAEGYYIFFANIYRSFCKALMNKMEGKSYVIGYPDIAYGVEGVRFIEACIKSAAQDKWIKLNE